MFGHINSLQSGRSSPGSVLVVAVLSLAIVTMLLLFTGRLGWLFLQHYRYQQALEAAALKAASDLSEIVIDDPYFGFVSLTDRSAIGHRTIAQDGQPLPVRGINTLIATSRLDYIIAKEIGDSRLEQFALEDARKAREAALRLNNVLKEALTPNPKCFYHDMDGKIVRAYSDALSVYRNNLDCFVRTDPKAFKLTLGWLKEPSVTITPLPVSCSNQLIKSRYVSRDSEINGYYRGYMELPVGNERFSLTGLNSQSSLVNPESFVNVDSEHICSIVKAQDTCVIPPLFSWDNLGEIQSSSCGQAYALTSPPAPSVLIIAFPDGFPKSIRTIRDLLTNKGLNSANMKVYTPKKGDFPIDSKSVLTSDDINNYCAASTVLAQAFHDWLRSNFTLPKVESVLAVLDEDLTRLPGVNQSTACVFALEITADGKAVISGLRRNPFEDLRVAENQLYAFTIGGAAIDCYNWTVVCRNEVHRMGMLAGGKHAGQPFPGDPINWAELSSYVTDEFAAAAATRRPRCVSIEGHQYPGGGIALTHARLVNEQGAGHAVRNSSCSAGLAAEIRISSPTARQ